MLSVVVGSSAHKVTKLDDAHVVYMNYKAYIVGKYDQAQHMHGSTIINLFRLPQHTL